MATAQKHERETVRAIRALHPHIEVQLQTPRQNAHKRLVVTIGTHTVRHSIACSPSDRDTMVEAVTRAVRRKFAEQGVTL